MRRSILLTFDENRNENNKHNEEDNENLDGGESVESLVKSDGEFTGNFVDNKRKMLKKNSLQGNVINST